MTNDRLANLRGEIEDIMVVGPIGTWTNPPSTFPCSRETTEFRANGAGRVCTVTSNYREPRIEPFVWRMVERERMRVAHSPWFRAWLGSKGR